METLKEYLVANQKAIVLTIHGSGEHIGRYAHVAEWLNQKQISMIGGDLPGLGTSKEIRGHIHQFSDYLEKVKEWLSYMKQKWPNTPRFIFGHSLGGLIVLRYLEELKDKKWIEGAIVSSPAVSIGIDVPKWQLVTAKALEKLWPTFRLKSGITANQVSRDKQVVEKYASDPLVYSKVSIRWFFEFQKAIETVWERKDRLQNINLLYLQAGADQLVDPLEATKFTEEVHSDQLEYHLIPDLYHEIFNEPEKEQYLTLFSNWILKNMD